MIQKSSRIERNCRATNSCRKLLEKNLFYYLLSRFDVSKMKQNGPDASGGDVWKAKTARHGTDTDVWRSRQWSGSSSCAAWEWDGHMGVGFLDAVTKNGCRAHAPVSLGIRTLNRKHLAVPRFLLLLSSRRGVVSHRIFSVLLVVVTIWDEPFHSHFFVLIYVPFLLKMIHI